MERGSEVLIDTNAIIEAHRVNCWAALCGYFSMETVEECVAECATGDQQRRDRTDVDIDKLRTQVSVNAVYLTQIASFRLQNGNVGLNLDPGEEQLLIHAMTRPDAYLICSPDKAAMKMAHHLGILARMVALESMAIKAGQKNLYFRENYSERWHRWMCSEIELEAILGQL